MKTLAIVKKGTISEKDKQELADAGFAVVEVNKESDIHFVYNPETINIKNSELLNAAFIALDWGNDTSARSHFGKLVRELTIRKLANK